jgi:hypothetical protein
MTADPVPNRAPGHPAPSTGGSTHSRRNPGCFRGAHGGLPAPAGDGVNRSETPLYLPQTACQLPRRAYSRKFSQSRRSGDKWRGKRGLRRRRGIEPGMPDCIVTQWPRCPPADSGVRILIDSGRGICYLLRSELLRNPKAPATSQSGACDDITLALCVRPNRRAASTRQLSGNDGRPWCFGRRGRAGAGFLLSWHASLGVAPGPTRTDRFPESSGRQGAFRIGLLREEPSVPCPIRARRKRRGWRRSGPA